MESVNCHKGMKGEITRVGKGDYLFQVCTSLSCGNQGLNPWPLTFSSECMFTFFYKGLHRWFYQIYLNFIKCSLTFPLYKEECKYTQVMRHLFSKNEILKQLQKNHKLNIPLFQITVPCLDKSFLALYKFLQTVTYILKKKRST